MSNDKSRRILEKIVSHIDHTLEYCQGQTFESFMDNRMLQEACIFNLLQIGELSKLGLDAGFTTSYPNIPWRHRLVHDYEGIRLQIVWETISTDFPSLKTSLEAILAR